MYKEIINNIKPSLDKTIEFLKGELMKIKTSRANSAMVENIEVECYDQKLPIQQLATINVPKPRMITIQPWDKNILPDIEKTLRKRSNLNPVVDGEMIRVNIPALSEEQRKEYAKIVGEKEEEAKISVRHHREEAWKNIQELEQEGKIREDDKFRGKDELQDLVDEYNEKIEEIAENKKQEIMAV